MKTYDRKPQSLRGYIAETERKSSADTQREIDFMRAMYAERRNLNTPRHAKMIGWSLVIVGVVAPVIAAIIILVLP